jgi:hypothetical protein
VQPIRSRRAYAARDPDTGAYAARDPDTDQTRLEADGRKFNLVPPRDNNNLKVQVGETMTADLAFGRYVRLPQ